MYLDEASIANGNNGESTLPVVTPQVVEEPETGLVPKLKLSWLQGFSVNSISSSMPLSTTGMSRLLWVPMMRPSIILMSWHKGYISLVTGPRKENWSYGAS